jgi:hypothetical protein
MILLGVERRRRNVQQMQADPNSRNGVSRRFADPRIVEFKPRSRPGKRNNTPIRHPIEQFKIADDRLRTQQNLAAAVVLALLMAAGFWLVSELAASSRVLNCLEAGAPNCLPLNRDGFGDR